MIEKSKCDMEFAKYMGQKTLDQIMGRAMFNMSGEYQNQGYTMSSARNKLKFRLTQPAIRPEDIKQEYVHGVGIVDFTYGPVEFELTEYYSKKVISQFGETHFSINMVIKGAISLGNNGPKLKLSNVQVIEGPTRMQPSHSGFPKPQGQAAR